MNQQSIEEIIQLEAECRNAHSEAILNACTSLFTGTVREA